jgi:beta-lactamase regulating signal transducer with metallopeptidase domain
MRDFGGRSLAALVYALLHSLWQGGVIFILLVIALHFIPARRAQCRYLVTVGALCAILFGALFTCAWTNISLSKMSAQTDAPVVTFGALDPVSAATSFSKIKGVRKPIDSVVDAPRSQQFPAISQRAAGKPDWMRWVAGFWAAGVLVFLARTVTAIFGAERLRQRAEQIVNPWVLAMVEEITNCLGMVRKVPLLVSENVNLPAVIGLFSPSVLIPVSLLTGLSRDDLRAIIWHELAHIQRWDYLVNIGQMIVESLLFFNPFVWLVSRQIRQEREACCDAIASLHSEGPNAYVKAMLACTEIAKRNGESFDVPAAAMALGNGRDHSEGNFLDRAKRLLLPGYRPTIRLRGFALANLLVVSGLVLVLLLQGAYLAARVLSPKERIEKITQLKKEYEPAPIPEDHGDIVVSGTVEGESGEMVPDAQMTLISRRKSSTLNTTCRIEKSSVFFTSRLPSGAITLAVWTQGYAPLYFGPFRGDKDTTGLKLVLKKGSPAQILVTDESGNPLSDVSITGQYEPEYIGKIDVKTDADGRCSIPSGSGIDAGLKLEKAGFQETYFRKVPLDINQTTKWVLSPAKPVTGKVVSARGGAPISNAGIRFCSISYGDFSTSLSSDFRLLTTSNDKGEFVLDQLRDYAVYYLEADAPGYGPVIVRYTKSAGPLVMTLGAKRVLRGRVINAAALSGTLEIECCQTLQLTDDGCYGTRKSLAAPVRNGTAEFFFDDLFAAETEIRVGRYRKEIKNFRSSVEDIQVDMGMKPGTDVASKVPKRQVRIRFDHPSGAPAVSGSIQIGYLSNGSGPSVLHLRQTMSVPVQDGVATFDVAAPNELELKPTGLIGYSFEKQRDLKVEAGTSPFETTIKTIPAGAIFCDLTEADGTPGRGVFISVYNLKNANTERLFSLDIKDSSGGEHDLTGQFVATPLPLGDEYQVVVWRDSTFAISQPIPLNETVPFQKTKLVIPEGVTFHAKVVDEAGNPVEPLELEVSYTGPNEHSFGRNIHMSDAGILEIPHVNLQVPGTYKLRYESRRKYQPFEFTFPRGQTEATIRVRHGKTLDGIVLDADTGKPMPDLDLYANVENFDQVARTRPSFYFFNAEARTDEAGRFHFSNLPAGRFKISCRDARRVDESHDDIATAGQEEIVTLKRKPISAHQ